MTKLLLNRVNCVIIVNHKRGMIMDTDSGFGKKMINPVLKSALKNEETAEDCVTYKSIYKKTGLFLLVVLLGVVVAFVFHFLFIGQAIPIEGASDYVVMSTFEAVILILCLLLALIMPIVASFWTRGAAVCGSMACFAYGYILGFMAVAIKDYQGPILLALALTIALVGAMLLLHRFKVVKVTHKFMNVVWILFLTLFFASFLVLICYFIPALQPFVIAMWANPWLSITIGVIGVVIGCLFLLCDFGTIEQAVENKLDKKYENRLAFGLAFSVIWLYFKVLDLILRIMEVTRR